MGYRVLLLLFLAILLNVGAVSPSYAQKSFWDAMFGWMDPPDNTPDPAQTLQAPFAYEGNGQNTDNAIAQRDASNVIALQHAHTNESVVGQWLIEAVSESMSHQVASNEDVYERNKDFFAPSGMTQFRNFMKENNIQKVIDSKRFNITSFVKEDPLLLNAGTADNRFRWLFEIPLMVSYMDAQNFNYKEDDPVNQHLVLTVQVGRVDDAKNNLGVLIETWSGKSQKIDKN